MVTVLVVLIVVVEVSGAITVTVGETVIGTTIVCVSVAVMERVMTSLIVCTAAEVRVNVETVDVYTAVFVTVKVHRDIVLARKDEQSADAVAG